MHTPLSMEEQVRSKSNKLQIDGKVQGKNCKTNCQILYRAGCWFGDILASNFLACAS